jgi:alkylation response protein AidB-like acyl-CoA dehydrogenase
MVSFELDEEQKMLKEAIDRFADDRMRKVFRDAEEEASIPGELVQAGWEFGLLPTGIPEAYGGFGEYSTITGVVALEAFAFGDLAMTLSIAAPGLVAVPLILAGTEDQKEKYLSQFCQETPPRMTAALTEPRIQFDPRSLKTTAVRDGESYFLNGVKSLVPLADTAELFLVYANEDGQTQAFFVNGEMPGLSVGEREKLMGVNALPTFGLALENCQIPVTNKLGGDEGGDFDLILNHSRVALSAAAVGVARAGYEYALEYAKNRIQFDEPIAHRQAIAFMLAEMATEVDAARLMVWETAWKLDQGIEVTKDATVMKHYVDDVVLRVADRSVQTLGGYGYIREYPVELWLRNARGFASFDGLAII